ncbi:phosphotyrosine interaction domain (PTB/PID) domain-containing protein [Ditylenchus destructor]|uniref:Phosphotyrosine interaction domain (PTB/PID) domain-containing protein n=1 Tax=Ditylenchus destructor TaxID=166010 RepID=A0AAD4N112_9BILA|nr:phosphotyrosine interaction domain (PTB/PID) domain-containing protein [Ditylenchus destructor]
MVAQQKIKDSSLDCAGEISAAASTAKGNPGSPKSRLAKLKRSSTKAPKASTANNDPFRFQGPGVDFKGKLIGERDVTDARGDAVCAEAMRLAKASVKSAGSHKQRIILNISIEGLKIRDEKSGSVFYNFPVAKISFVARDTTDARAFSFIFGSADGKYKFYGIKTAQTADHAVLSIRDMFQVVFEMKKKQVVEMKQKQEEQENMERESTENGCRIEDGVAVADLLDLESELQNLEQGFNQLRNIPSMPEDDAFASLHSSNGTSTGAIVDPFGDSFNPNPAPQIFSPPSLVPTVTEWPSNGTPTFNGNGVAPLVNGNGIDQHFVSNGHNIQQTYSGTNPFANPSPVFLNGNGGIVVDPFDTQSAHRVINGVNTTHSYGILHPTPAVQTPPTLPAPVILCASTEASVNWGITHKENKAPNGTDNGFLANFNHCNGHTNGVDKQKWEEPGRVSTLEEAFNKLVDMNQLVTSNTNNSARKNPFEHIINPPKVPLNALASSAPTNGFHGHTPATNGHFYPSLQNGSAPANGIKTGASDPFNDDFFN